MNKFETAKCSFTGNEPEPEDGMDSDYSGPTWSIPIPPALHRQMDEGHRSVLSVEQGRHDSVLLQPQNMKELFDPIVQKVVNIVVDKVKSLQDAGTPANQALGAGGFMTSPYLQRRLRQALAGLGVGGAALPLIVMPHPESAVVKGECPVFLSFLHPSSDLLLGISEHVFLSNVATEQQAWLASLESCKPSRK